MNKLSLLLALLALPARATDYYVSSTAGNDNNDGLSASSPWKTLSKVQSKASTLKPGDQVLFRAGLTFTGSLTLSGLKGSATQPIRLGRYGAGNPPAFDGGRAITGWSLHSGKIWKATVPTCASNTQMLAVYRNGQFLEMGREPDANEGTGWRLNTVDHGINTRLLIEDSTLSGKYADNHWKGAQVVARSREWLLDIATVDSHTGATINLNASTPLTYGIVANYGYFFRHSLKALDQDGEWYHDRATGLLYVYSATTPGTLEFACEDTLLKISNSSHLAIQGLAFQKSRQTAVVLNGVTRSSFVGNEVKQSARNAVEISGGDFLRIANNLISDTQNNALSVTANNSSLHDNAIYNTALGEGMGSTSNGQYMATRLNGTNNLFAYNKVVNSGYNAIHFGGDHWVISQNVVDAFNVIKTDGAGIYTWDNVNTGSWISKNIVLNGVELAQGLPPREYGKINGLYSDGAGTFNVWEGNSVFNCAEGLFNHQGSNETFVGNTVVGSATHSLRVSWDDGHTRDVPSRDNTMSHNLFVAADDAYAVVRAWSQLNDVDKFGVMDNNRHVVPLRSSSVLTPLLYTADAAGAPLNHHNQRSVKDFFYGANDTLSPVSQQRYGQVSTVGSSLTQNPGMDDTFNNNVNLGHEGPGCSASFMVKKVSSGGLDGNTMRCEFVSPAAGDKGVLVHKNVSVVKDQLYRVRLSLKGSVPTSINFRFRTGSGGKVHGSQPLLVETTRTDHVFYFRAAETTTEGRVLIDFKVGNGVVDLDNFDLFAVKATEKSFHDVVQFKYNDTKADKQFTQASGWLDHEGKAIPSTFTLKPFESKVLFKAP